MAHSTKAQSVQRSTVSCSTMNNSTGQHNSLAHLETAACRGLRQLHDFTHIYGQPSSQAGCLHSMRLCCASLPCGDSCRRNTMACHDGRPACTTRSTACLGAAAANRTTPQRSCSAHAQLQPALEAALLSRAAPHAQAAAVQARSPAGCTAPAR
jgi:hypothetical protein